MLLLLLLLSNDVVAVLHCSLRIGVRAAYTCTCCNVQVCILHCTFHCTDQPGPIDFRKFPKIIGFYFGGELPESMPIFVLVLPLQSHERSKSNIVLKSFAELELSWHIRFSISIKMLIFESVFYFSRHLPLSKLGFLPISNISETSFLMGRRNFLLKISIFKLICLFKYQIIICHSSNTIFKRIPLHFATIFGPEVSALFNIIFQVQ